jgi:hypothetical protein
LDKYNQKYIDKLNAIKRGHGTAKTIEQLYDEITKHAFLNYDVESEKPEATAFRYANKSPLEHRHCHRYKAKTRSIHLVE